MNEQLVIDVINTAIKTALAVAGPLLITALVVGVLVSIVQAVTQIQEQTLTFVPKVGAMAVVLFLFLPWFMRQLVGFLVEVLEFVPHIVL